ncbi:uncharacterized protein LOC133013761 [Limanda limanda]|uniref:uncharacterized protein LOC133013761 n=1 Tax=Limanda limanda TaxID=27771 RepID=UPI0029C998FF|nr:uncharacterized protein LOC133013761 [Limanda limanda]
MERLNRSHAGTYYCPVAACGHIVFGDGTKLEFNGWISVSRCEFHVMEVQTGEEVTLLCTNYTSSPSHISWFRLENGSNTSLISSMLSHDTVALYFDGFEREKFNMTSNVSNVFLQIKQVDLSDSGLYICGYKVGTNRKFPAVYSATYLKVKERSDDQANLTIEILMGGLIIILIIIIIALVLKIWKLLTDFVMVIAFVCNIVFGDGTKLEFDDEVDWLVVFLSVTSAFPTLLSVLLAFSLCMMRVTGKCYYLLGQGDPDRRDGPSTWAAERARRRDSQGQGDPERQETGPT